MAIVDTGVAGAFVDALVARDLPRALALLHPEIDFRGMTPNRIWEAEGPAGVEQQAYVRERDGRIGWMRVMCSGPMPLS